MIIKLDIPDEVCFNQFKHFMDSTFDFELVKMYDICSNDTIQYLQVVQLKQEQTGIDKGINIPTEEERIERWRKMFEEDTLNPLYGNIKIKTNAQEYDEASP